MSVLNKEMWCQLNSCFQDGQWQQAEALLQPLLAQSPDDPEVLYLLGVVISRSGRQQGQDMIARAIVLHPRVSLFHFDPALVLNAIAGLANPVAAYQEFLRLEPDDVAGHDGLAISLARQGQVEAAVALLSGAMVAGEGSAETYNNLGRILRLQNRFDEALLQVEKALTLDDGFAEAYLNRGSIMRSLGKQEAAVEDIRRALQIKPDYSEALDCLAYLLKEMGCTDEAVHCYKKLCQLRPDSADALVNLGMAYDQSNRLARAEDYYRQAIALDPRHAGARNNLANVLKNQLRFEEAAEQYRAALQLKPDFSEAHSNLLFLLSYNVLCGPEAMLEEHRRWDQLHGVKGRKNTLRHDMGKNRVTKKKLRVGYVSPDFRAHSVSYFFEPIAKGYDRQTMEIYCYAEIPKPDAVTERLQSLVDGWRSTVGCSDEQVARQIYQDGIDVLVDLTGHTANNRLKIFTYQPAPVQLTYMGYFTTTGLQAMDFWVSDRTLHPEDTIELSVERIYHLPRCFVAYEPYADAPDVVLRQGQDVVFGSFNELSKIAPRSIKVWSEILHALPSSRLLLKARQLSDEKERDRLLASFASWGITPERLILRSLTSGLREHLAVYGEVDITLDTMPRTGFTTTTEALWMGVPVITLPGERFIERVSASMLEAIGMDDWVANSEEDYIAKAVALAQDPAARAELRRTQRARMAASPLCDGVDLAQHLEQAYRELLRLKFEGV